MSKQSNTEQSVISNTDSEHTSLPKVIQVTLIICGSISVGLGTLGIFLPVLPTTPFLLLAAACYARSSKRFYNWILNNRWFGEYIRNYREGKGVRLRHKTAALILLWGTILSSMIWATDSLWLRILLACIAAGVTTHLLLIKTYRITDTHNNESRLV